MVLSSNVAHEMGHCFGLFHTHHGTCPEGGFDCSGNPTEIGNPGTGDYVDDTPVDPAGEVDENCVYQNIPACDPYGGAYDPYTDNIMSYYYHACRLVFTIGQNTRMLNLMPSSVIHDQAGGCCGDNIDIHLYTDTDYDSDKEIPGNIFVHEGAQLTVTAKLQFGENKSLVVLQGGKLVVDGGHLTKCPDAENWDGIVVEGYSNQLQPDVLSPASSGQSGIVHIKNNSLIEWAKIGIYTNYYDWGGYWTDQKWGGLVVCENSAFINNKRAVAFMKYDLPNKSSFSACLFAEDDGEINTGKFP